MICEEEIVDLRIPDPKNFEDDVQIAANVQIITNNHDLYERMIMPWQLEILLK